MKTSGILLFLIISASALAADLDDVPPNTWVKVLDAETGGREQPIFVYAEKIKRFVMATGMQAYGGDVPRHGAAGRDVLQLGQARLGLVQQRLVRTRRREAPRDPVQRDGREEFRASSLPKFREMFEHGRSGPDSGTIYWIHRATGLTKTRILRGDT